MLTPLSENLYIYLSTYGGEMFNNETLSKKAFAYAHSFAKFNYDIGYYFEDMNSINLLNYIGESNYILLPKMIYYIKEEKAKKLKDLKIISIPEDFEFHDPSKDEKEFEGYNEIDLAIYNKKEVCIQSNENFKLIPKDLYLKFKPANKENSDETKKIPIPIKLKENEYYLFEMKTKADLIINDIDNIRVKYNRYIDALNNTKIIQDGKFNVNKSKCNLIFVCNNSYDEAALAASKKEIKEDFIYSNPQVGLSILLKYDNKFKYLNEKVNNANEQLKKANKKDKEEFNKKLKELKEENNKIKEDNNKIKEDNNKIKEEFKKEIDDLKNWIQKKEDDMDISKYNISRQYLAVISNPMNILFLIKTRSEFREDTIKRYEKLYNCFEEVSKYFKPIKEKQKDLCIRIIKYIGKDIIDQKEQDEWRAIKNEILTRYGSSVYYKGLVLFLFGENHENKEDFSILSENNSQIRKYVKNLIIFLAIFMDDFTNEDIEEKFQSVIVYIAYAMIGIKPISELLDKARNIIDKITDKKEKKKIIKLLMQDIITSFNSENKKRILDNYSIQK